jgi:cellulose synthase/poly-beta-1,6-N-acetylglucosamine synthase-like glycosyltransferase
MVGIPAFNEEKNIGKLLDFLIKDVPKEVEAVCVVSSGSTDRTDEIVVSHQEKDSKIRLITEPVRGGKASAVNVLLNVAEKYDVVILLGADNLPKRGSMKRLINALRDGKVDIVGGRPVPVNDIDDIIGFCVHLLWNLHHLFSLRTAKVSGELMAFRTGVVSEIPQTIVNDDVYVQSLFQIKGYKVGYCPEALVYLRGPSTMRDFLRQRRRVFWGHLQIKNLLGKKVSTMKWPGWSFLFEASPTVGIKAIFYILAFMTLQGIALLSSVWSRFLKEKPPYQWEIVKTTKSLT